MRSWLNSKAISAFLFFLIMPLAACSAEAQQTLPVKALAIHTKNGVAMFQSEIAVTPAQLERGLMYRKELASNKAMLFIFSETKEANFWMENTLIPLDIIFIKEDGTIAHIHPMAKPLDRTPIKSHSPVKAVLEIFGGESAKQGIAVGDTIDPTLLKTE